MYLTPKQTQKNTKEKSAKQQTYEANLTKILMKHQVSYHHLTSTKPRLLLRVHSGALVDFQGGGKTLEKFWSFSSWRKSK